jgi:hypothetical protein
MYNNGNMGLAVAAAGVLWPGADQIDVTAHSLLASSKLGIPLQLAAQSEHNLQVNHGAGPYSNTNEAQFAHTVSNGPSGMASYNDLYNNAASMSAAAKYSCAAAASSFCSYPFPVDEYNPTASQIQVGFCLV